MVQRIRTRAEFEQFLADHPAVKKLPRQRRRRPNADLVRAGAPQLLLDHADADTATAVLALRRVMGHHRRVTQLKRRLIKGAKVSLATELALVRKGRSIETDFREMLRSACSAARRNPRLGAYAEAMASRPTDAQVFANPAFLSPAELEAIRFTGIRPDELGNYFAYFSLPRHKMATHILKHHTLGKLLAITEKQAARLQFPESPRQLAAQGILTLGGSDELAHAIAEIGQNIVDNITSIINDASELLNTYLVPVVTIAAGVIILPFAPTVGLDLLTVGLGTFVYDLMQAHPHPDPDPGSAPSSGPSTGPPPDLPPQPEPPRPPRMMTFAAWLVESLIPAPNDVVKAYGYAIGNMSPSKREIHLPGCSFLHLARSEHLRTFDDIKSGHAAGLDNCYYCIGDSKR